MVIGSKSDLEYAEKCREQLAAFRISGDVEISSAHRHPDKTAKLCSQAQKNGYGLIIAMAGLSAALPGVAAAHTDLPVIGVPLPAALGGIDSLLSIVQMPPGIPVATVAIGGPGAKNAAVLAARILALKYPELSKAVAAHRKQL
ncbi:MAG: 5-(carboxyamino)imidazole ribonucleotide mutase [Candidatus Zixiibacteriota bacterium]|nr:MAG: 5-(carboxyamino)imidazole ribonucleotide mutase [candidate division Zixibacteria bacterium]